MLLQSLLAPFSALHGDVVKIYRDAAANDEKQTVLNKCFIHILRVNADWSAEVGVLTPRDCRHAKPRLFHKPLTRPRTAMPMDSAAAAAPGQSDKGGAVPAAQTTPVEMVVEWEVVARDLSENQIQAVPRKAFRGITSVKNLRLHSNNLHCDCHLTWLSDWLRQRRGIAQFTQCMAPAHMRGLNVADAQKKDFICTGPQPKEPHTCSAQASSCPPSCTCNNNIVDCRGKGLTEIPANLPEGIVEMMDWDVTKVLEEHQSGRRMGSSSALECGLASAEKPGALYLPPVCPAQKMRRR
ncbi:UNVERIFIED_CONTAM: hypothetical protein FKN15_064655 [Acipenser sinensis]